MARKIECGIVSPTENLDLHRPEPNEPWPALTPEQLNDPCATCGHGRGSHRQYQWIGPRDCCAADCRCKEFRQVVR